MERFSVDEMNVLSTAIVALIDSRLSSRKSDGRFVFRCGDGKKRKMTEAEVLVMMDKITFFSGHGVVSSDALDVAKEAGIR